jgi:NAD(P)-dependent dehydrogenase (short-subunit alcohol dehydrogenase family)
MTVLEKYSLKDKVALITGGAGLLGVQHANALTELGATVILTDLFAESLNVAKENANISNGHIFTYELDVTDSDNISSVNRKIIKNHGGVDILINNAALNPKVSDEGLQNLSRFENFSETTWANEINVGLTGAFLCCKEFGYEMAKKNGGVILNIASDLSVISPNQNLYKKSGLNEEQQSVKPITYSVIKTGLIGLTLYLSTYWADKNVRVNALSPGGVFTGQDQGFVDKLTSLIPMGRMANIDEYHGAIQFLCSDASSYMNGQNIVIDGGRSIW